MYNELLDTAGIAVTLNTTERHIRELRYRRVMPCIKVGRLICYDADEVLAALRANTGTAA